MSVIHNQHPPTITLPSVLGPGSSYTCQNYTNNPMNISEINTGTFTLPSGASYTGSPVTGPNTLNGSSAIWTSGPQQMRVEGDAEFHGKLKVGGKDIGELMKKLETSLEKIEKRVAILHPNVELEDKWKDLKALGEQYRELEKYIIEKEKTWEILNR